MKRREFALGAAALAVLPNLSVWAASGDGYIELKTPVPMDSPSGQIEVIEFFSYGCLHCRRFQPIFGEWKKTAPKDLAVRMVHVGFSSSDEPLQRIFYTIETMGLIDTLHSKIFEALQSEHKRLYKPEILFPWVAEQGVDRAKFEATYKSFGVANKVQRATQLQEAYQVEATPSLGIAGRYYTDPAMAKGFESMLKLTQTLIEKVRQGK